MKKYISLKGWHICSLFICLALGILSANAQTVTYGSGTGTQSTTIKFLTTGKNTWSRPSSVKYLQAELWGAGGAGGGTNSTTRVGGGGQGGTYAKYSNSGGTALSTSTYNLYVASGAASASSTNAMPFSTIQASSFPFDNGFLLANNGTSGTNGNSANSKKGPGANTGGLFTCYTANATSAVNSLIAIVGTPWAASASYVAGQQVSSGGYLYTVTTGGTSTSTAPSTVTTSPNLTGIPFQAGGSGPYYICAGTSATFVAGTAAYAFPSVQGSGYISNPGIQIPISATPTYATGYGFVNIPVAYSPNTYYILNETVAVGSSLYTITTAGTSGTVAASSASATVGSALTGGTAVYGTYSGPPIPLQWQANTFYGTGQYVTWLGKVYYVATGGTSNSAAGASSFGPTGTGTGITDGGVTLNYYGVASPTGYSFGPSGATFITGGIGGDGVISPSYVGGGGGASTNTNTCGSLNGSGSTAGVFCGTTGYGASGTTGSTDVATNPPMAGSQPGGGAAGYGSNATSSKAGGTGGTGQVILSYNTITAPTTTTAADVIVLGATVSTSTNGVMTIVGANLTGNIAVSVSGNFQVSSTNNGSDWGSTATLTATNGAFNGFLYFRLNSSASNGSNSGTITLTSATDGTNSTVVTTNVSGINSPVNITTNNAIAYTSDNTQQISWTNPASGYTGVVVIASQASSTTYTPVQGTTVGSGLTANTIFGSGTAISSTPNSYVVYNAAGTAGATSSVEVTGLTAGATYYYQIYAYNGSNFWSVGQQISGAVLSAPTSVTSLSASVGNTQSVVTWSLSTTTGTTQSNYWDDVLILAYPTSGSAPTAPSGSYSAGANAAYGTTAYGAGAYAVYYGNGSGSTGVTVSALSNFSSYSYAAYVWHNATSTWSSVANTSAEALPALNVGDFVSTTSGVYSSNTTWSIWNGTTLVSAGTNVTPSSTSTVYIAGGNIVNVTNTSEPANATLVTSTTNSSTTASAYNLYVVNGTLKGTDGTNSAAVKNTVLIFGPHVGVGSSGVIGDPGVTGNTSNGIEFFMANNGGTTLIDNYPSHGSTPGSINLNKILLYASNTTCEIATSMGLHYHGSGNNGQAVALGLDNSSGSASINGTITIDNGATVTMDQECVAGPYTASNKNDDGVNFTLNINGTLTFTSGWGSPQVNGSSYNFNGYLSLGNGTANTGTAGTGSYLHIGSTGILNVPEFYPNGTNFAAPSPANPTPNTIGLGDPGNGQIAGIVVDAGGQLNVGFIADLRTPGQTVTGGGSFNFNSSATSGAKMYLGSSVGMDVIQTTGTNSFDATASTYQFTSPTAWAASNNFILGECVSYGGNIYRVSVAGLSTSTPPTGTGTTVAGATFVYVSGAAQTTGTKLPASVYGLSLANSSGVTLSNATTVTNSYAQTGTVLTASSSSALLTLANGVTAPTGSSTNYIAGPLTLYSQATSSLQTITFPIGFSAEDYVPVALTLTQSSATATAYTLTPTVGTATHGLGTLGGVTSLRYYTIAAAGNSFTNGSISLNYSAYDDDAAISLTPASNLRIAEYISGSTWTDLGPTNGTGSPITSSIPFTSLGQFAIANHAVSQPAPAISTASNPKVTDASYNLTFTDNVTFDFYNAFISAGSITYNGTLLSSPTDYTIAHDVITIKPNGASGSALRTAGTNIPIVITASNYNPATVYQTVLAGAASQLVVTTQPVASATADGVALTTQPIVAIQDAYGNSAASSANITATVGAGSSSYFTLGGTSLSVASNGIASTFALSAINRSTSNVTGSITFSSAGLASVTSTSLTIQQPTTYWWVGGTTPANGAWPTSPNTTTYWALSKGGTALSTFNSSTTDIYVIDGTSITVGGSGTNLAVALKYLTSPTLGQLIIQNGAQVTLTTTSSNLTINIAGDNGANGHVSGVAANGDLYIDGASSLTTFTATTAAFNMLSGTYMNIAAYTTTSAGYNLGLSGGYMNFNAGATATVSGIVNVGVAQASASNCFIVNDAGAVQFLTGSTCIVHQNSSGYPFGKQGSTYGVTGSTVAENTSVTTSASPAKYGIVFKSGSNLNYQAGLDVFGGSTTSPVIQLQSGSNFNVVGTGAMVFDGYTFSNLVFNNASYNSYSTGTGSKGFTCDNLTVSKGTVSIPEYGTITINGNLTIGSGDSLSLSPTSAAIVNIPTATAQTINGVFTVGANTTINFTSSLTIASSGVLQGTGIINASAMNVNGTISPNTSTTYGTLTVNKLNLGGGSTYYLNIKSTASPAGTNWDSLAVTGTGSAFTIGATSGNKDTIALVGTISSFTNTSAYSWNIGSYAGTAPSAANTVIITRGLTNTLAGTFSLSIANGNITLNYSPLPAAPTNVAGVDGDASATISFTLPVNSSLVSSYTVTSSPGNKTATGTNSPITVTGLTNNTPYTFIVTANNSIGSTSSTASNSVTPSNTTIWNGISWSAGAPLNITTQSIQIAAPLTTGAITTCNDLIINSGVTLNTTNVINVVGYLNDNGTITGDTIVMSVGAGQTMFGTGLVSNLKINNTNGVTITSGNIGVTGLLTIQSGLLTTGGYLTLKSTSVTNTAVVGPVTGSISGNVTVERFIPRGPRTFRDLGAGGVAPTTSVFANWQEGGVNNNGFGTQISGIAGPVGSYDNASGFDYSPYGGASLFTYKSQIWDSVSVANGGTKGTTLDPFQGFRLLIRGDRTNLIGVTQPLMMTGNTILRSTGSLIYGNVIYNVGSVTGSHTYTSNYGGLTSGAGSFSFITNPYASVVDWNAVIANNPTGMNDAYWYNDPTFTTGGDGATFVGYTQFIAYSVSGGVSNIYSQSKVGRYLQPGQAIFVQNPSSGTPVLKFNESSKVTTQAKTAVFGNGTSLNRIALGLFKNGSNLDGAVSVFNSSFSKAIGNEDAIKFPNATENLTFSIAGKNLAINGYALPTASDVLSVHLTNLVINTTYSIKLDASQFSGNGLQAYIKDNVLNTTTLLSGSNNAISFTTTSVDAASYASRYSIVFGAGLLPVTDIKLTATAQVNGIQVAWATVGESNVANYTVQHSVDGVTFTDMATVAADNNANAAYSVRDSKTFAGTNYYRIKVSSNDGTVSYSNIATVSVSKAAPSIAAYPNPLVGNALKVALNNLEAGKYNLAVYNTLGAKVVEKSINHVGGTVVEQLSINSHLAAGAYSVRVSNSNGVSYQSQIEVK